MTSDWILKPHNVNLCLGYTVDLLKIFTINFNKGLKICNKSTVVADVAVEKLQI